MGALISVNAHSSIKIVSNNKKAYFDPYMITKDNHDADLIFITHSHYDHFSPEDIKKIRKGDTFFIAPCDMKQKLLELGIKEENVLLVKSGDTVKADVFSVKALPAYNLKKPFHPKENGWVGYLVNASGETIYVAGDTDYVKEMGNIKCDIALIPIGGTYTMDIKDGAKFINDIKPKTVIPTHYGSVVGEKDAGQKFSKLVNKDIEVCLKY